MSILSSETDVNQYEHDVVTYHKPNTVQLSIWMFAPKGPPFSQPRAAPWGAVSQGNCVGPVQRTNNSPRIRGTVSPLGRFRFVVVPVPRDGLGKQKGLWPKNRSGIGACPPCLEADFCGIRKKGKQRSFVLKRQKSTLSFPIFPSYTVR